MNVSLGQPTTALDLHFQSQPNSPHQPGKIKKYDWLNFYKFQAKGSDADKTFGPPKQNVQNILIRDPPT